MTADTNRILAYDLLLKVEGQPQEAFVQHGMTIGRAGSNAIVVAGAAVEHIHARVFRAADGQYYIKGESATAKLVDAENVLRDWLPLKEGVTFKIGDAVLSCRRHIASRPTGGVVVTDNPWLVQCPVCYGSLVDMPRERRQCPHCGKVIAFLDAGTADGFRGWLPLLVGPYKIRAFVGQGGMGVVIRGIHSQTDASAAVKLLRLGENPEMAERFLLEAETLRNLAHPNVVTLQDSGRDNRMVWLAMDWVDGVTISRVIAGYVQNRRLPPLEEIADIAIQTARGLEYLHARGIVHRDLKPQNLIRANDNLVKILDFGLARQSGGDGMLTMLTQTGMVAGTAGYMSPEQSSGETVTPASDIFSLGIILYEMLTGRRPMGFAGPVSDSRPDCPPGWQSLVMACLAPDPASRPSAKAVALGLQAMADDPAWDGFAPVRQPLAVAAPPPAMATGAVVGKSETSFAEAETKKAEPPPPPPHADDEDDYDPEPEPPRQPVKKERRKGSRKGRRFAVGAGKILAVLGILVALGVAGFVGHHLLVSPTLEKADRLLEEGNRKEARDMLKTLADNHNSARAMSRLGKMYYQDGDDRLAAEYLEKAVEEEDLPGISLLGEMTTEGRHPAKSSREGVPYLNRAAERNDARAQYLLGVLHLRGNLTERDPQKGMGLLERAADGGETDAHLLLGQLYLGGGDDFPRDTVKAIPHLTAASENGRPRADHLLGRVYAYGLGVPPDYQKAAKYVQAAHSRGVAEAREPLAYLRFFGKGMPRDINAGVGLATAILKDNPDDSMGAYITGLDHLHGYTVSKNPAAGLALLKTSAQQGNPFALFDLGRHLFEGKEAPRDLEGAYRYFRLADGQDNRDARPYLARYHYFGLNPVDRDHEKAYSYLEDMNLEADLEAQAILGILLFERQGPDTDTAQGLKTVERAARQGSNLALAYLGRLHVTGVGVPRDIDKAIRYLGNPAKDLPEAMYWLGRALYEKGDYSAAFGRFQDAARHGEPGGNLYMGKMHYLGRGAEKNHEQAAYNLYRAGVETDAEAQGMLAKINYFGLAGKRDYAAARLHLEKIPADDDELKLIAADLSSFGHGGAPVDREKGMRFLAELIDKDVPLAFSLLGKIYHDGVGVEKNHARARELFETAAATGEPESLYRLGYMYHEGQGVPRDDAKALGFLERASAAGSMEARSLLGMMYFDGDGVERNTVEGVDLLTQAAAFGILESKLFLGEAFCNGRGVPKNVNLAADYVREDAEAGNRAAQVIYGKALMDGGFNPKPDSNLAIEYLTPAAEEGDAVAQRLLGEIHYHLPAASQQEYAQAGKYFTAAAARGDLISCRYLAEMYDKGKGFRRDGAKAAEYLEKLVEADDVPAMGRLGELYLKGDGVPRDEKKAFSYFRRMADSGKPEALYRLGMMYYGGTGVERDMKEALRLLSEASRKGSLEAAVPLGEMYFEGQHVPRDYGRACLLLASGEKFATPRAHAMLGWMYLYGQGTEQSNGKALKHLEAAIPAKEPLAAAALASVYLEGDIVVEDYGKARVYAEMGLSTGLPVAYQVLGRIYAEGLDVRRDPKRGEEYLVRAADAGDVKAQYHLGMLYMDAQSGIGDAKKAYKYFQMAADQGDVNSTRELPRAARRM